MARRPDVFNQKEFEDYLRRQGTPESMVGPIVSDYRLFVPLALRELGPDGLYALAEGHRAELKLGPQQEFWREVAKYAVGWADEQIEAYKAHK
jgi:hypothetical protein